MIPKDSEFLKLLLQALTENAIISRIVGSNTKQFISDFIIAQNFQDNIRHILTGVMITEAFECQDLLMKFEIIIDPMSNNP